ncbi:MAG: N-acyl-D-amino-acid deacylase family protein [Acidobacteriaceae bacterium]
MTSSPAKPHSTPSRAKLLQDDLTFLKNATLVDGSGAAPRTADLLLSGQRIAEIGTLTPPSHARILDCTGLIAAPGFVDAHSHSDLQVLQGRLEKTRQGVTTEIVGNCGFSPYPMAQHAQAVQQFANGILCGHQDWGWPTASAYLEALSSAPFASVYSLIGHGSLRIEVAGNQQRPLTEPELDRMEHLLDDALSAGAIGFSTGLMYAPGSCAPQSELERLCRVVARHGKVYATHMRSYSFGLLSAIEEQLELARRTGCRLQISHLQAVGRPNWPHQAAALERIEAAAQNGVDVAFDCYPYTAGNSTLTQLTPQWALDGGLDALVLRLRDPLLRRQILDETRSSMAVPWTDVVLTSVASSKNQPLVGQSLAAIALLRRQDPAETLLNLLIEEHGEATMLTFNQSMENLRQILTHPLSIIITDGLYVRGKSHPRLHGTFPRLLGELCRGRHWLTIEDAIHKITGKPTERFAIPHRGLLKPGYYADLTLFDPEAMDSKADYDAPETPPTGIHHIFRNGKKIELPPASPPAPEQIGGHSHA